MAERIQRPLEIVHVAAEMAPFAKTGGLGDVLGALPRAQADSGANVTVILPRYRDINPDRYGLKPPQGGIYFRLGNNPIGVGAYELRPQPNLRVLFIDHRDTFDRPGIYAPPHGPEYADNAWRFALLSRAAIEITRQQPPDILHAHDWQAAPALVYQREFFPNAKTRTVFTIHNLGYQGHYPAAILPHIDFPLAWFHPEGFEFFGTLNLLKAGIVFADALTTVSPTYAAEIQTPDLGMGLDGLLRKRHADLTGILNGVDAIWDPAHDSNLAAPFSAADRAGKAICKASLQTELGLPIEPTLPLYGAISRLTPQKGFDLLLPVLQKVLRRTPMQFALLGSGDTMLERDFTALHREFPQQVAVRIGYSEPLAHRIEAGADFFLMPSRYEPCGLNQMYSMRYGTLPIVRKTGGLDDAVTDVRGSDKHNTGFKFVDFNPESLFDCIDRAQRAYMEKRITPMIERAMREDFSWNKAAAKYLALYDALLQRGNS